MFVDFQNDCSSVQWHREGKPRQKGPCGPNKVPDGSNEPYSGAEYPCRGFRMNAHSGSQRLFAALPPCALVLTTGLGGSAGTEDMQR